MHKGLCGAGVVRKHPVTWRVFDASAKPVGVLAQTVAKLLIGKHKPTFRPNIDNGDVCVVINAEKAVFTGKKWKYKKYYHHSGRPGSLQTIPAYRMLDKRPAYIIEHAVKGMLPRNNSRPFRMEKLIVCEGPDHPYTYEFAPDAVAREAVRKKAEMVKHRHAFVQKPYGPIFWKNWMKYRYSANYKKKAWAEFHKNKH